MNRCLEWGRAVAARTGAVVGGALVAAPAFAGDLADAVTAEIAIAKGEILLVGAAVMGIVGALLLIRSVKRAAN